MSTVKISQLAEITQLNANTANSLFMGVDLPTGVTGKFTAHVLAQGLYSNEVLNVGNNAIILPDVAGQFAGTSEAYVQINHQNLNGNGSGDIVVTANMGTDSTYYVDMGINGNTYNYDGYTYAKPLDGYLIVQGNTESDPGGNLVIGTTTAGKDIYFVNGSIDESEIVMQYAYHEGFKLLHKPLYFADGTTQNTAAQAADLTTAVSVKANTTNSYAYAANTFLQANDATTLAVAISTGQANVGNALAAGKVYTDAANTWLRANDASTLTAAKFYSDTALGNASANLELHIDASYLHANAANVLASAAFGQANTTATALTVTDSVAQGAFTRATAANNMVHSAYAKANNALANTSGIFDGNLTVTGNLIATGLTTANLVSFIGATTPSSNALVEIIGSVGGSQVTAASDGYMLHVTGKDGIASKVVIDSFGTGTYPLIAGRSGRGSANTPTATQAGDVLLRVSSGGYGTTGFSPVGSGRIDFVASENYTDTTRGSKIIFYNVMDGTNTITEIASFNANTASFSGSLIPTKGIVYTPRLPAGDQTAITIDYLNDSIIKANCAAGLSFSHTNFLAGKVVEVWITNTSGIGHTITHGCSAINSTVNSTTFSLPSTSSAYLKFFSIDGDLANTFVSVIFS